MRDEPPPISIPSKIAVAALGVLLVTMAMMLIFGDRKWHGLDTLLTASALTPLSAVLWPLVEVGGNKLLFGIDAARRAIWQRDRKMYEAGLKAGIAEGLAEGLAEGRAEGVEEGYQQGYDARAAEEMPQNGAGSGHTRRRRRTLRDDH